MLLAEAALAGDATPLPLSHHGASCGVPDARGVQLCQVGLDVRRMVGLLQAQKESQWCWAASIAMVFAGAGFQVSQEDVVRAQFGELLDLPVRARDMTELLGRTWRDAQGRLFAAQVAGRRADDGLRTATEEILQELAAGRMLIVGVASHAVVLARVHVERFTHEGALRIVALDVLDPSPGAGVRRLDPSAQPVTYLAAIQVMAADAAGAPSARPAVTARPAQDERAGLMIAGRTSPRGRRR